MKKIIMLDFPNIYSRLVTLYPSKPWLRTVENIGKLSNQFAGRGGQEELDNSIAFGLTFWDQHKYAINAGYEWNTMFQAMIFVQRVVDLCEAVDRGESGPKELKKRFEGALRYASDMRALQYELYMASLLVSKGCSIVWPEESKGIETFDLLVYPPQELLPFELECKSFSGDKGFAIELADGNRLLGALLERISLAQILTTREGFASILTITVTGSIPKNEKDFKILTNDLVSAIQSPRGKADNAEFSVAEELCSLVGDPTDIDACWNAAQSLSGCLAGFIACGLKGQNKGIRLVYTGEVRIWKEVEKVAKRAFKKQLTGKRPGALALQFINDTIEPIDACWEPGNKYRLLSESLFRRDHALMLIVTNSTELGTTEAITPYRPDAFLVEYQKCAAFYNKRYDYLIPNIKVLFAP